MEKYQNKYRIASTRLPYWDHIVRDRGAYHKITQYIRNNPKKWEQDKLNGGKGNKVL